MSTTPSVFELFETDTRKEKDGFLGQYGTFRCRVLRAGGANKAFVQEYRRLTKGMQRAIATQKLDDESERELMARLYSNTVIRDPQFKNADGEWIDGIPTKDGTALEGTRENVADLMMQLPSLLAAIKQDADDDAMFLAHAREEEAENS